MFNKQIVNKLAQSKHFWAIIILLINVLQALFTNLHDDEAYYWLFSKHLDWGFYDHPPMVAIFVKMGYFIFQNTFGVRLLAITSSVVCYYLIFAFDKLFEEKVAWIGLAYLAVPILNLYGFIQTPDVPLLLFGVLYLMALKAVIENKKWSWLALSLTMSLLSYSKYHGAIIVFFSLLPAINKRSIVPIIFASLLAAILFIPHVLWQIENDWPSFQYHLVSRHKGFNVSNLGDFFGAILFVPGVFFLWPFWRNSHKIKSRFSLSLEFTFWGFLLFFALMLFKGKIEIHWIAFSAVPALLLSLQNGLHHKKFFRTLIIIQLILILGLRIVLASYADNHLESFKKDQKWANRVKRLGQNHPVVFMNSFQKASKYQFFTDQLSWSDNNRFLRKNQFDLWKHDTLLFGRDVYYLNNYKKGEFITDTFEKTFGGVIEKYIPMQRLSATCGVTVKSIKKDTLTLDVHFTVTNPYHYSIDMLHPQMGQRFYLWLMAPKQHKVIKLFTIAPNEEPISIPIGISEYDFELTTDFAPFIKADKLEIIPLIMKGPLYGQILGPEIEITIKHKAKQ